MDLDKCKNCKEPLPEKIKKFASLCNNCFDKGVQFQNLK